MLRIFWQTLFSNAVLNKVILNVPEIKSAVTAGTAIYAVQWNGFAVASFKVNSLNVTINADMQQ